MRLFHFTAARFWPAIKASSFLKVVDSNISVEQAHAGPDVVWLTTESDADANRTPMLQIARIDAQGGYHPLDEYKNELRLTVEIPDAEAYWWPRWSRHHGISDMVYDALAAGALPAQPEDWYVVTRSVVADEWCEVIDTRTGTVLWAGQARGSNPPYPVVIFEDSKSLAWFQGHIAIVTDKADGRELKHAHFVNFPTAFESFFHGLVEWLAKNQPSLSVDQAMRQLTPYFNWQHLRECSQRGERSALRAETIS